MLRNVWLVLIFISLVASVTAATAQTKVMRPVSALRTDTVRITLEGKVVETKIGSHSYYDTISSDIRLIEFYQQVLRNTQAKLIGENSIEIQIVGSEPSFEARFFIVVKNRRFGMRIEYNTPDVVITIDKHMPDFDKATLKKCALELNRMEFSKGNILVGHLKGVFRHQRRDGGITSDVHFDGNFRVVIK